MSVKSWQISSEDDFDTLDGEVQEEPEVVETEPVIEETTEEVIIGTPKTEEEFDKYFPEESEEEPEVTESGEEKPKPVSIDSDFFKAKVNHAIEKYGLEDIEDQEWTEETYSEFEEQLFELRLQQKYESAKQSNELVNALLSTVEAGGDVSDILALFEQKKEFKEIDTTTIDGKLDFIGKFHREVEGKKPEWIEKQITRLKVSGDPADIEEEYNSISAELDEYTKTQQEQTIRQAEESKRQKEEHLKKQVTNLTTALDTAKYKKQDSNKILDFVFKEQYKIRGTDTKLTALDAFVAKAKNNPEDAIPLAEFLMDRKAYEAKIILASRNEENEKKFNTIKFKQENKTKPETNKFQLNFKK